MPFRGTVLTELDHQSYELISVFLNGRLKNQLAIEWVLKKDEFSSAKRVAVLEYLNSSAANDLPEPWLSTWRAIQESWAESPSGSRITDEYEFVSRITKGERTGTLITEIVNSVKPVIKVKPRTLHRSTKTVRPRHPNDLISISLSSGRLFRLPFSQLNAKSDLQFLNELATRLEGAIAYGLDVVRRHSGEEPSQSWRLGGLHRVRVVSESDGNEPDEFHEGIAPSVKMLHEVVNQLATVSPSDANLFLTRWRHTPTLVHTRLWASLAQNSTLASSEEVGRFLLQLDNEQFWDLHEYPEVSELRAARFGDLTPQEKRSVTRKLRRLPPRGRWPRNADPAEVQTARRYWAARELKRIEVCGNVLPTADSQWLVHVLEQFEDLRVMERIDEGFLSGVTIHDARPKPDDKFELISGTERLDSLESALRSTVGGWDDGPSESASNWIRRPGNLDLLVRDFETAGIRIGEYPSVLDRFGWSHSPSKTHVDETSVQGEISLAERVFTVLCKIPETSALRCIEGISHWMDDWGKYLLETQHGVEAWLHLWPVAMEITNAQQKTEEEPDLSIVAHSSRDDEPLDLDTLNTAAGRFIGGFLSACGTVPAKERPFQNSALRKLRDVAIASHGRANLITLHRLIEVLPWFLRADPEWTHSVLLSSLESDEASALPLWRALARRTHYRDILHILGSQFIEKAKDARLGRTTRHSLIFSIVVELLHSFREQRESAVSKDKVTQLLRTVNDEDRARAAEVVQQFVRELSRDKEHGDSAESLFASAAKPFLEDVWPKERSLTTPGISKAFADLPAVCGSAFSDAAKAIERFLVPFQSWSMHDYALRTGGEGDDFSSIDNPEKAEALLALLDRTISSSESANVPMGLGSALQHIKSVSPKLGDSSGFRRLASLTRR